MFKYIIVTVISTLFGVEACSRACFLYHVIILPDDRVVNNVLIVFYIIIKYNILSIRMIRKTMKIAFDDTL